jgi:hypothetical protein
LQRRQSDEQTEVRQMLTETSRGLQGLDGACPNLPDHVAAQTSRLLELRATPTLRALEQGGVERISARLVRECRKPPTAGNADCTAAHERLHSDLCTQLTKQTAQGTTLDYWRPGTTPQDQDKEARQTMAKLSSQVGALFGTAAVVQVASAPQAVPDSVTTGGSASVPATGVEPLVAAGASPPALAVGASEVEIQPQPVPSTAIVKAPAPLGGSSPSAMASTLTTACPRATAEERTVLYVQVYDENTLRIAARWRQVLLDLPGGVGLQVAPVENVVRAAELRQQRRPAPWPRPTFILHDPSSRRCAKALAGFLKERLAPLPAGNKASAGADDKTWMRDLPATQTNRRAEVIELWLPTGSLSDAQTSAVVSR